MKLQSNIRRLTTTGALFVLATFASAGTFTDITVDATPPGQSWYTFTGEIKKEDVAAYEAVLASTEDLVLVIDSPGGCFYTGMELGRLTERHTERVSILMEKAYSAAGLWALADDEPDFLRKESELGLHLPYVVNQSLGEGQAQRLGYEYGRYMESILGQEQAQTLMDVLGSIRDEYGPKAMLVFRREGKPEIRK